MHSARKELCIFLFVALDKAKGKMMTVGNRQTKQLSLEYRVSLKGKYLNSVFVFVG